MSYKSTHTGAQIDAGVSASLNPDATPTLSSTNLVTSGGVKTYVDTGLNGKLSLAGGTMTGNIAMTSHSITGLAAPTNNGDAVTKKYVDDTADDLKSALKSGDEEDAIYHLGFYLDENGDLCQVEEETNNG